MWIIRRCYMDYDEVWKLEHSTHETEKEADDNADRLREASSDPGEWYEVCEVNEE